MGCSPRPDTKEQNPNYKDFQTLQPHETIKDPLLPEVTTFHMHENISLNEPNGTYDAEEQKNEALGEGVNKLTLV